MLHLLRVSYRLRPGFPPHEAEDARRMLLEWRPPAGLRVVGSYEDDGGLGGVFLFEVEQLSLLSDLVGTFDLYFDFQVAPASDREHPLAGPPSSLTWDHSLIEGRLNLRII